MITLLVMLAGGLGAVARFVVDGWLRRRVVTHVPVGTVAINLAGSLALGLLAGAAASGRIGPDVLRVVGTGACGGFTTFSTASLDAVRLLQERHIVTAVAVVAGVALAATALAGLGYALAS